MDQNGEQTGSGSSKKSKYYILEIAALIIAAASALFSHFSYQTAKESNFHSKEANELSNKAISKSEEANNLSEEANNLSEQAISKSEEANNLSEEANNLSEQAISKSEEANNLSEEANEIAKKLISPNVIVSYSSDDNSITIENIENRARNIRVTIVPYLAIAIHGRPETQIQERRNLYLKGFLFYSSPFYFDSMISSVKKEVNLEILDYSVYKMYNISIDHGSNISHRFKVYLILVSYTDSYRSDYQDDYSLIAGDIRSGLDLSKLYIFNDNEHRAFDHYRYFFNSVDVAQNIKNGRVHNFPNDHKINHIDHLFHFRHLGYHHYQRSMLNLRNPLRVFHYRIESTLDMVRDETENQLDYSGLMKTHDFMKCELYFTLEHLACKPIKGDYGKGLYKIEITEEMDSKLNFFK